MKNPKKTLLYSGAFISLLLILLTLIPGSACADELTAMFATAPSSGHAPLNVSFIDQSEGFPVNWTWDYDDTTPVEYFTSNPNPNHTYTKPGSYYPSLVVDNNTKTPDLVNATYTGGPVHVYPPLLSANFTGVPRIGYAPLNVVFIDQSTGPAEHRIWNFDETNVDPATPHRVNDVKNPMHTYVTPGTYTVNFTVSDNYTSAPATQSLITVYAVPPPDVEFSASPRSGTGPLEVSFTSIVNSTDPLSYEWDFGDGSPLNYEPHPVHTYTDADTYNVTLGVTGPGGETIVEKTEYIGVSSTPAPIADFAVAPSEGFAPLRVDFIGLGEGDDVLQYSWNFGDGVGAGNGRNPSYTYTEAGYYNVTCIVNDGKNSGQVRRDHCVRVLDSPLPVIAFAAAPTKGEKPLNVTFIDLSSGVNESPIYHWNFGDGTTYSTSQKSFVHRYETSGIWTPGLNVESDGVRYTGAQGTPVSVVDPPSPKAMFTASSRNGTAPLEVEFIDQSVGSWPLSWEWDLGDGSPIIHDKNPVHIYEKPGLYNVSLLVKNENGKDLATQIGLIKVQNPETPKADFVATPVSGTSPLSVSFIDQSLGTDLHYIWDFGDGNPVSYEKNPVHQFNETGLFTISLTVSNDAGSSTSKKEDYIFVTENDDVTGMFTASPRNGTAPLEVFFIDQSVGAGPLTWEWDLGDGSPINHEKNPVHIYEKPGNYNVSLLVKAGNGQDLATQLGFIKVQAPKVPKAGFVGTPVSGTSPLSVSFIDQSLGTDLRYMWDFGDGSPVSYEKNPVHQFTDNGLFNINLTVTNIAGSSISNQEGYINVTHADDPVGMFTASPRKGPAPLKVSFIDQSKGTVPLSYKWNFGDETPQAYIQNPVHEYTDPGVYNVSMQVTGPRGSDVVYLNNMIEVTEPVYPQAAFTLLPNSGTVPLEVKFIDQSVLDPTGPGAEYLWEFGEGNTSDNQNPVWTYTKWGRYDVSLTVKQGGRESSASSNVTVSEHPRPNVSFSMAPISGVVPLKVSFIDNTCKQDCLYKYLWEFGDKQTSSKKNPVHEYVTPGNYTVKLSVTDSWGVTTSATSDTPVVCKKEEKSEPVADFTYLKLTKEPLAIQFIDNSFGSTPLKNSWEFGDSTTSTEKNPKHEYKKSGSYAVNLTVTDESLKTNSTSEIIKVADSKVTAAFSYTISKTNPLLVHFKDESNGDPYSWKWSYGDGLGSSIQSPDHLYSRSGIYVVNLTAGNSEGSDTATTSVTIS
jgi:PKD repeat protein